MVEAAGGSVTTRYYTKDAMRRILDGDMHSAVSLRSHADTAAAFGVTVEDSGRIAPVAPATAEPETSPESAQKPVTKARIRTGFRLRLPDPTSRKDLEYYRDSSRRGYLAYEVLEGDSPSLYFKTLKQKQREVKASRLERKQRRILAGTATGAAERRTPRPGERLKLW